MQVYVVGLTVVCIAKTIELECASMNPYEQCLPIRLHYPRLPPLSRQFSPLEISFGLSLYGVPILFLLLLTGGLCKELSQLREPSPTNA